MAQNYYDANGDLMVWTGAGYHRIPSIDAADWQSRNVMSWDPNMSGGGDWMGGWKYENRYGFADSMNAGEYDAIMAKYGFPTNPENMYFFGDADKIGATIKSGDKEGTQVEWTLDPATGKYVPKFNGLQSWNTNQAENNWAGFLAMAGMLGAGAGAAGAFGAAGAPAFGGAGGAVGGEAAANPYALTAADFASTSAPASAWGGGTGVTGASYVPGTYAGSALGSLPGEAVGAEFGTMLGASPGMEAVNAYNAAMGGSPYTVSGEGIKAGSGTLGGAPSGTQVGSAASQMPSWQNILGKGAGAIGSVLGGGGGGGGGSGSGGGSALGGLLGAGLGYLDARNQPDSLTIKTEIDPRLAQYAYGADGAGGIAGAASNLMNQQLNGPNPLAEAGKKISGMANTTPDWASLVSQNKSLWDTNPYVEGILKKTQEGITSQMGKAGFNAGSFGNTGVASQTADALANAENVLRYNAFNDWQNRAMTGAVNAGNYGLSNQLQQAGLLGKGAEYQQQGSWAPIQNATNVMAALPGNTSRTEPLFNNPWAGALGGASLGSQVGGGIDWGSIFNGISGLFGGGGSSTPPPRQNLSNQNLSNYWPYNWG